MTLDRFRMPAGKVAPSCRLVYLLSKVHMGTQMKRFIALLAGLTILAGCTTNSLDKPPPPLGDFKLGHNVVIADKMSKGPVSRDATAEEWTTALKDEIDKRFGRYDGDQLYHLGVSVEGYMLAPPGLPLVYTPKSVLVVNVTVWDNTTRRKLNPRVHQITVLETTSAESLAIGSGWGRTKEEQIAGLSFNAVAAIETWMQEMSELYGWFTPNEVPEPADAPKREPGQGTRAGE